MKRKTIGDVAKKSGYSIATVSRVLLRPEMKATSNPKASLPARVNEASTSTSATRCGG